MYDTSLGRLTNSKICEHYLRIFLFESPLNLNRLNRLKLQMSEGHEEKVDDTKGEIRSRKSKDKQYSCQNK
jgi:hypothetical protein